MFKDKKRFASTGGWGYARWVGMQLEPYQNDGSMLFLPYQGPAKRLCVYQTRVFTLKPTFCSALIQTGPIILGSVRFINLIQAYNEFRHRRGDP